MKTTTLTHSWNPLVWVNPPSSPDADDSLPEEVTLFSPTSITIATLIGGAMAGFLLMAINSRRLGRWGEMLGNLLVGGAVTAILTAACHAIPCHWTVFAIVSIASAVYLRLIAVAVQGPSFRAHAAEGGPFAPLGLSMLLAGVVRIALFLTLLVAVAQGI